jgi:23S rRNA (guanosine2251-2'-O)-methyltransferase
MTKRSRGRDEADRKFVPKREGDGPRRRSSSGNRRAGPAPPARTLLQGINSVEQALLHRRRALHGLWLREGHLSVRLQRLVELGRQAGLQPRRLSAHELDERAQSPQHQGIVLECGELPTLTLKQFLRDEPPPPVLLLALDQIEDPQNLGGLVRTAAFLGAQAILMHRARRAPLGATASRASAGALEHFPIIVESNLAHALAGLDQRLYHIIGSALDAQARDYREEPIHDRLVVVVGSEGRGLRRLTRQRCHRLVRIPGEDATESLNVSVAAGILLAHFRRSRVD